MGIKCDRFKLLPAFLPPLSNGTYQIIAKQEVTKPEKDNFGSTLEFLVSGRHFTLPETEVYSVYPPADAQGCYRNSVAHITMWNKTFPWENQIQPGDRDNRQGIPFVTLLSILEREGACLREMAINELTATEKNEPDIFYPLTKIPPSSSETEQDRVQVLEMPVSLFCQIAPSEEEVALLAHVKKVDMYHKADDLISEEGMFSVVTAGRFIPSANLQDQIALKSSHYLVSLEGYHGYLPGGASFDKLKKTYQYIRFVCFYSWDVYSQDTGDADYKKIIKNLDCGAFGQKDARSSMLKHGYVPLEHVTRSGEKTVSLYGGPLSGFQPEKKEFLAGYDADGRIVYEPEYGIFDMSYACAWQMGRLMALHHKSIALELIKQRRNRVYRAAVEQSDYLIRCHLQEFTEEGDFEAYCLKELLTELVENSLIGPVKEEERG